MIYRGDLGVHNSIKVATQVYRVVKKVYGMLAFIGVALQITDKKYVQIYRTLVWLHLEYFIWRLFENFTVSCRM